MKFVYILSMNHAGYLNVYKRLYIKRLYISTHCVCIKRSPVTSTCNIISKELTQHKAIFTTQIVSLSTVNYSKSITCLNAYMYASLVGLSVIGDKRPLLCNGRYACLSLCLCMCIKIPLTVLLHNSPSIPVCTSSCICMEKIWMQFLSERFFKHTHLICMHLLLKFNYFP